MKEKNKKKNIQEIYLSRGKISIIDSVDFDRVSKYKWSFCSLGYAERRESVNMGGKIVRLHRFIMNAPKDKLVDHINGDGLDNRRVNLRLCTKSENMRNRNKTKINKSGYKGVYFETQTNKWKAQINIDGKNVNLGRYPSPILAAKAYDKACKKFHGNFGKTNG